jgi:hypothetical protein
MKEEEKKERNKNNKRSVAKALLKTRNPLFSEQLDTSTLHVLISSDQKDPAH